MHRWFLALRGDKVLSVEAKKKYFAPHVKEYPDGDTYYGYSWVSNGNVKIGSQLVLQYR